MPRAVSSGCLSESLTLQSLESAGSPSALICKVNAWRKAFLLKAKERGAVTVYEEPGKCHHQPELPAAEYFVQGSLVSSPAFWVLRVLLFKLSLLVASLVGPPTTKNKLSGDSLAQLKTTGRQHSGKN